jgi:hypothetical protein
MTLNFFFTSGKHSVSLHFPLCSSSEISTEKIAEFLNLSFMLFSFFVGLGFELRASHLAKEALYHLSQTSSPFSSGYFEGGIL